MHRSRFCVGHVNAAAEYIALVLNEIALAAAKMVQNAIQCLTLKSCHNQSAYKNLHTQASQPELLDTAEMSPTTLPMREPIPVSGCIACKLECCIGAKDARVTDAYPDTLLLSKSGCFRLSFLPGLYLLLHLAHCC